jgi:hypothetical protein
MVYMTKFVWIEGYEGKYQVSDDGQILSFAQKESRLLKQNDIGNGYLGVSLSYKGVQKTYRVHVLVAKAFCPGYSHGLTVNHKDLNKRSNKADNLEWITNAGNMAHARAHGLYKNTGRKRIPVKAVHVETNEELLFRSMAEAAKFMGGTTSQVSMCCNGKRKKYANYRWSIHQEEEKVDACRTE